MRGCSFSTVAEQRNAQRCFACNQGRDVKADAESSLTQVAALLAPGQHADGCDAVYLGSMATASAELLVYQKCCVNLAYGFSDRPAGPNIAR